MSNNPWFHIWSHPSEVIQAVTSQEKQPLMFSVLAFGFGVLVAVSCYAAGISIPDMTDQLIGEPIIKLPILIVVGGVIGILFIHVSGMVASWSGRLSFIRGKDNKGAGDPEKVRVALAWSLGIFHIWVFLLALVATFVFWLSGNINGEGFADFMFGFFLFVLLLWSMAWGAKGMDMVARCLAYAQELPREKAVNNLIVTFIITLPPFLLMWGTLPFII